MQRLTTTLWASAFLFCLSAGFTAQATDEAYGNGAITQLSDHQFTIPNMLKFAIEDEYLARGEYQKIMEKFGSQRPFSNIIKAEERHIAWLEPLFKKYNVSLPTDRGSELAVVPANYADTFEIGVNAEIANIQMYTRFLAQDLPDDIRDVFKRLKQASENHLAAFKRGPRRSKS